MTTVPVPDPGLPEVDVLEVPLRAGGRVVPRHLLTGPGRGYRLRA